ncbi:MAG TPA: pentapeptide repeat-containing protein, partial [Edaphobacter sp.]
MSESLQQRVEKIRLWAKDPDRAVSRIIAAAVGVVAAVVIALCVVWIVPKYEVRDYFSKYLRADLSENDHLKTELVKVGEQIKADQMRKTELEKQLNDAKDTPKKLGLQAGLDSVNNQIADDNVARFGLEQKLTANTAQISKDTEKKLTLENEFRKTITQIVLSLFGLFIVYLTWKRARAGDRTVEVMEQGHITDRFTKAIEQLGKFDGDKPNIEVRLGAIYALERIAGDSPRDHWTIMEVLTAYVRQNAPAAKLGEEPATPPLENPRTDIQAILTVLGRRPTGPKRESPSQHLDLTATHLENIELQSADLSNADFSYANLTAAKLQGTKLQNVTFFLTNLENARLQEVDLQGTALNLVKLHGANLRDANLKDAFLAGSDLRNVDGLEPDQVKAAILWKHVHY